MQIFTADEQLHRQRAQQASHDRFVVRWLTGRRPVDRKAFAKEVEAAITDRLRAGGHSVARTGANEHYDLLVDGLRVEVKAAARSGRRYAAALRGNDADVLILCCRDGARDTYFVMPFDQVRNLTHIKISRADPAAYAGRLRIWLEAWPLIERLIAQGVNHWQPALL